MAEQHPLTDSKALSLFSFEELMNGSHPITIEDAMRKAADWQLSQVLEFIAADPTLGEHVKDYIFKAMRLQQG
tara:strand:+ start:409 stop:627 length:219 start_codon:yes stop_codon:yes gene_type:complete